MNYLERLDIHPKVQSFFKPYFLAVGGTIKFHYTNDLEHVSPDFHKIPTTGHWMAGEPKLSSDIFICGSAMDAICYLHLNHTRYHQLENLCFIAINSRFAEITQQITPKKKIHFIFPSDDLGIVCNLKLASQIRNKTLKITWYDNAYQINFENKNYQFDHLTLNALEKASGYNFRIRTHKPKNANTYYEQLRQRHHP